MMSSTTASSGWRPITSSASRPPGHLIGSMPSIRSRVSTSSAMIGWSSTMRTRGLRSKSDIMAVNLPHTRVPSAATCSVPSRFEDEILGLHPRRDEPVEVPAAQPGGAEPTLHAAVGCDPGLYELEEILQLELIALHADDLADLDDLARPIGEPRDLDEHVHRESDLLTNRLHGQFEAGHQDHHLEPLQALARRVRVHRGERPVVAGVHRGEHVQ